MLNKQCAVFFVCCCIFSTPLAVAREIIGAEIRAGISIPTEEFGGFTLDAGSDIGVTLTHWVISTVGVYAGWGVHRFDSDEFDIKQSGYVVGFEYSPPLPEFGTTMRFRLGITYENIEIDDNNGAFNADSGHDMGIEIGAAIPVVIASGWAITPGIRYKSLATDSALRGSKDDVRLSYAVVDIGMQWQF